MQKVRYSIGVNRFNIKFQEFFIFFLLCLFTFHSHYYSLSMLNNLILEVDSSLFNRRITFYDLLKNTKFGRTAMKIINLTDIFFYFFEN
jgi:hypothetical protein